MFLQPISFKSDRLPELSFIYFIRSGWIMHTCLYTSHSAVSDHYALRCGDDGDIEQGIF